MSGFHQQLMQQELDGAKEAAASYEKQVKRLLAENATLRQWNEQLASELGALFSDLKSQTDAESMGPSAAAEAGHEGEELEAAHLLATASALRLTVTSMVVPEDAAILTAR